MSKSSIGDRELLLLRYLDAHGAASVGATAAGFGAEQGLARSTVLTMLERLRAKGFTRRRKVAGVYRYSAATRPRDAVRRAVSQFVEGTLNGSVSPFVAWMAERGEVSDRELAELEALVAKLQDGRKEN